MKNFTLQAAERIQLSDNWIALLFVFCLLILFLLKLFDAEKMKGYSLSIFSKGFAEMISKEKQTIFSLFRLLGPFQWFNFREGYTFCANKAFHNGKRYDIKSTIIEPSVNYYSIFGSNNGTGNSIQ